MGQTHFPAVPGEVTDFRGGMAEYLQKRLNSASSAISIRLSGHRAACNAAMCGPGGAALAEWAKAVLSFLKTQLWQTVF